MAEIVLVPGAWHGPWCWDLVARQLTSAGHRVHAVLLRGHDQPGQGQRLWHRLEDYVADVAAVADVLPEPPVLIGHSLGGLIVQRFLDQHQVAGAVLMAPIPARALPALARLTARHPWLMARCLLSIRLRPLVEARGLVREMFFTTATPWEVVEGTAANLGDESVLAVLQTLLPRGRHPANVPVLVMGAEHDTFFTPAEIEGTAAGFGTSATWIAGSGHDLMLDVAWPEVADQIHDWVTSLPPPQARGRVGYRG